MLFIRKQIILLLLVCTYFVYVLSASTYSNKQHKQDIDDHETQNTAAPCKCTNGKCVVEGGKEVCKCPPEYGNYSKSLCKACDCGPSSNCTFINVGWFEINKKCLCKSGYNEENGKCIVIPNPCDPNPCQNDGTCTEFHGKLICICPKPFSGLHCETDLCTKNPCMNDGKCRLFGNSFKCDCKTPYFGDKCEKDPCTSNPCQNGGTCSMDGQGFKCSCKSPFKGKLCENETNDPCASYLCQNGGTCLSYDNSLPNCVCMDGYYGPQCEKTLIEPCASNPCKNGGTCLSEGDSFECKCKHPFYGIHCEKACKCKNGECVEEGGKKVCKCLPGYGNYTRMECRACECGPDSNCMWEQTGWFYIKKVCLCKFGFHEENGTCVESNDPCASYQCKNGGTCFSYDTSLPKCVCMDRYYGLQCEKIFTTSDDNFITEATTTEVLIEACASNPCQNGGTCSTEGNGFKCKCKHPFYGIHCEKDIVLCTSNPCQNEGICVQKASSIRCYCKPPYFGVLCEKDQCTENPCQNGGTCIQVGFTFKCKCDHPFSGDTCQYDACSDNPCFNGGTCVRDGNSFKCKCRNGYYGTICEKDSMHIAVMEYRTRKPEMDSKHLTPNLF